MAKKTSLGTGLSSLIPNKLNKSNIPLKKENFASSDNIVKIPIESVVPNPNQPRLYFSEDNLKELSESIKEHGVIQPVIVTRVSDTRYELIAGERRLQASKLAGLKEIPAIIRLATSREKLELALVENIQRYNLNPIEEAKAYRKLQNDFGLTQEEIAKKTGKSRSAIANITRLLELPVEIQKGIIEKKITEGHARAILALENSEKQRALYELIIRNGLTVRAAESKIKEITVHAHRRKILKRNDPYIQDLEDRIQQKLGTKVKISKRGKSGKITIDFYSEEDFKKIIKLLDR
jgi:ParB family chromosome partitioning protein